MAKIRRILMLVVVVAAVLPASAQFKIGPRVGIEVNSLHFSNDLFSSDNRAGITAGLQAEFTVPVIGVGADLSVMYVHRTSRWITSAGLPSTAKSNYVEIPLNVKYKLSLPAISHIIAPYIFTGPSFAILASTKEIAEFVEARKCDVAWNFGFGVELVRHLQIGASYGLGMTKALNFFGAGIPAAGIEGKNRYWTVTAAWLF